MIGIINILLSIIWLIILPFALGLSMEKYINTWKKKGFSLPAVFASGFVLMLASFHVIAVPLMILDRPFTDIAYSWAVIIVIIAAVSVFMARNKIKAEYKDTFKIQKADTITTCIWVVVILMIVFETWILAMHMHTDADDVRFISESLEAFELNSVLKYHPITGEYLGMPRGEMKKDLCSPYPFFIAAISKLINITPAITAHTIFPVLFIPLCFAVFYMIGKFFLKEGKREIAIYMLLLTFIVLFSFESVYSIGYTLLTIIWQGRSILATSVLPLLILLLTKFVTEDDIKMGHYVVTLLTYLACACLSGMGLIIPVIVGFVYAFSVLVVKKSFKRAFLLVLITMPTAVNFLYYLYISRTV